MRLLLICLTGLLVAGTASASDLKFKWMLSPLEESCKDVQSGDVDAGEDFILRRCENLPFATSWLLYQEGTRVSVGFGRVANVALANASTDRFGGSPVQWGITEENGKTKAVVAIVRFSIAGADNLGGDLFVFRLLDNGMSCVVNIVPPVTRQNEKASEIARAAVERWTCLAEPEPITP